MDFPKRIVLLDSPFCDFKGDRSNFYEVIYFCQSDSADPDEMPPFAAFHLGLHCLPKYLFISTQNKKDYTGRKFL